MKPDKVNSAFDKSQNNFNKYIRRFQRVLKIPVKFRIGFEIWEVFTMLTIVLTLASAVMWFGTVRVSSSEIKINRIEEQKHIVYNYYLQAQKISTNNHFFHTPISIGQVCYQDVLNVNIDSTKLENSISVLENQLQEIDKINNTGDDAWMVFDENQELSRLYVAYTDYINMVITNLRLEFNFKNELLEIQKMVSELCMLDLTDFEAKIESIKTYLSILNCQEIFECGLLMEKTLSVLDDIQNLVDAKESDVGILISELENSFSELFNLDLDKSEIIDSYENFEIQIENSFRMLELEEKRLVEGAYDDYNVVYIYS